MAPDAATQSVPDAAEPTQAPDPTEAPAPDPTQAPAPDPTAAPDATPAPDPTEAPAADPTQAPAPDPTQAPVASSDPTSPAGTGGSGATDETTDLEPTAPTAWSVIDGVGTAALPDGETWSHILRLTVTRDPALGTETWVASLVTTVDGVEVLDPLALDGLTGLRIVGTAGDDQLTFELVELEVAADGTVTLAASGDGAATDGDTGSAAGAPALPPIPIAFEAGDGDDTLTGPKQDAIWWLTALGEGIVNGLSFRGVEHLVGSPDNEDAFVFNPGSIGGTIDGGAAGWDWLVLYGAYGTITSEPATGSSGLMTADGATVAYAGLEPIVITQPAPDLIIDLSGLDDDATLSMAGGMLHLEGTIDNTFETHDFAIPAGSLTIRGGLGLDTIRVEGLVLTSGADITLEAENIILKAGSSIDTRQRDVTGTTGDSGAIELNGEDIDLQQADINGVPTGVILEASVDDNSAFDGGDITIDATKRPNIGVSIIGGTSPVFGGNHAANITLTGAFINGATVEVSATGASSTTWDDPGDYWDQITEQLLGKLQSFPSYIISGLTPISGQVEVQLASATVTVDGTLLTGSGAVSVTADASADASFEAIAINAKLTNATNETHMLVVVGYGQAEATATVTFSGQSWIRSGGTALVEANAETEADVSTAAHANTKIAQPDDECEILPTRPTECVEYAFSVAVAVTLENATTTIGKDTLIESDHGNVGLLATGEANTSGAAETAVFLDGNLGAAFGIGIDVTNIKASVAGTVIAHDPTSVFEFDAGAAGVVSVSGDTITVSVPEATKLERGQSLVYHAGPSGPLGGLTDGATYTVERVEDLSTAEVDGEKYATQRIRLAWGGVIDLDNRQVNPLSTHTIDKVGLKTFNSTGTVSDQGGDLAFVGLGFSDGQLIRYLGPSSSSWIEIEQGDFIEDGTDDRIHIDTGTPWNLQAIYVDQQIQVKTPGANLDKILVVESISADGKDLFLKEPANPANALVDQSNVKVEVKTQPTPAQKIASLEVGKLYQVAIDGGFVKLLDPEDLAAGFITYNVANTPDNPSDSGVGVHGFTYTLSTKAFTAKTAVDNDADTIAITNHGLSTGDLIIYTSDPTKSTDVQLWGWLGPNPTTAYPIGGVSQIPDAPIDGLHSAYAYFVVVVDADHIRLVPTKLAALRALPINITSTDSATHSFTVEGHGDGVTIKASLKAENAASSGVELSDSAQSWVSVTEDALGGDLSSIGALAKNLPAFLEALKAGADDLLGPFVEKDPADPDSESGFDVAVAVSVNLSWHTVEAYVEPGAAIFSGTDITVDASAEESVSLGAAGEATRNGADDNSVSNMTTATREDVEIGIGFGFGSYKTHVRARVQDSVPDGQGGTTIAHLDAAGDTTISSSVKYPLRIDSVDDVLNPAFTMKESGLDGFEFLTDGTLGFGSGLFNVWVTSLGGDSDSASADKFVLGGALAITLFDLESSASIGRNAQINQGIDPEFASDVATVSVLASTETELVDVAHIAAFNLSLPALIEGGPDFSQALKDTSPDAPSKSSTIAGGLKSIVNPFGVSGQKGIGAGILISSTVVDTSAEIREGAMVETGTAGDGLKIEATQDLTEVAVGYTGSQATDFGLNLTLIIGVHDTDTRAGIRPATWITGGPVTVNTHDTIDRYVVAGQVLKTERIGIGIAVGINVLDRVTLAYIGRPSLTDPVPPTGAVINVDGPVSVTSTTDGELIQIVVGGGLALPPEPDPRASTTTKPPTSSPEDRLNLTLLLTVSVAVNDQDLETRAHIDSAMVHAEGVTVEAKSEPLLRGVTVAVAGVISKPDPSTHPHTVGGFDVNLALAGAISVNVLEGLVKAAIVRSFVDAGAGSVLVKATDHSTLAADGGGAAVVVRLGGEAGKTVSGGANIAIGAGVGINWIDANTETAEPEGRPVHASIEQSVVKAGGDIVVHAKSEAFIEAVALAFSFAGQVGSTTQQGSTTVDVAGAGAGSGNDINTDVHAWIVDALQADEPGIQSGGGVRVKAEDVSTIFAVSGALALSANFAKKGDVVSAAIGLSAARNNITNNVQARIDNSTVFASGTLADEPTVGIAVDASSKPTIEAFTFAGAGTFGQLAGTGAGSGNYIDTTVDARVEHSYLGAVAPEAIIRISANDESSITADAGGIAVALNVLQNGADVPTIAIGIGIAINEIVKQVHAIIDDSMVTAAGDIFLVTGSVAVIIALTFGAALTVLNKGGNKNGQTPEGTIVGLNLAGGGAGSYNRISGHVENAEVVDILRAAIQGESQVISLGGTVHVTASDTSTIDADAAGLGVAIAFETPDAQTDTPANIQGALGIGVAINELATHLSSGAPPSRNGISALILGSNVTGEDGVSVRAISQQTIDALTLGGGVSAKVSSGDPKSLSFNIAGGGAGAKNDIAIAITAQIKGSHFWLVNSPNGEVLVEARDLSKITANAGALGLGIDVSSGTAINISLGVAVALNKIDNDTRAEISGLQVLGESVRVVAGTTDQTTIDVLALGMAFGFHLGTDTSSGFQFGVGLSLAINRISNDIQALVGDGAWVGATAGNVTVVAQDRSKIIADGGGFAVALDLNAGDGSSATLAGGISIAENTIENVIRARVSGLNTLVDAVGMTVKADNGSEIKSLMMAGAGSVSVKIGQGVGFGGSVAVNWAGNKIDNTVEALIEDVTTDEPGRAYAIAVGSGGLTVEAIDHAKMDARWGAAALTISIGLSDGSSNFAFAISVGLGKNVVDNTVAARIKHSTVTSLGGVTVHATSDRDIFAEGANVGVSVAITISQVPVSAAGSGVGIDVENVITGETRAEVIGESLLHAGGAIQVVGEDTTVIDAAMGGGGLSVGVISVSVVVVRPTNTISNVVEANVTGSALTSETGGITIKARSKSEIRRTDNGAVSVSVGIGGSGTRQEATATIEGHTSATVDDATLVALTGTVTVQAITDNDLHVFTYGGSGSVIAASVIDATGVISRSTTAAILDGSSVAAAALTVTATALAMTLDVQMELGAVSVLGSGTAGIDTGATGTASGDVEAWIGQTRDVFGPAEVTRINVDGLVQILATSTKADVYTNARGGSGSVLISVSLLDAAATVSGATRAYLGRLGDASAAEPAQFYAGGLTVDADASASKAVAKLLSVGVGLLGAGVDGGTPIPANATVSGSVTAWVQPSNVANPASQRVQLVLGADGLVIDAEATATSDADARGGTGGIVAVVLLQANATTSLTTNAFIAAFTTIFAGNVEVTANSRAAKATAKVEVGSGSVLAGGGKAEANADVSSGAVASIGNGAFVQVTDGWIRVQAATTALGKSDSLIATGGLVAGGREAFAETDISGATSAWIGDDARVAAILQNDTASPGLSAGDIIVSATAKGEGDAKGQAYGGELLGSGSGGKSVVDVTPTVRGSVGVRAQVVAYGDAQVSASFTRGTANLSTAMKAIDVNRNLFAFDLELVEGQFVLYAPGGDVIDPLKANRLYSILTVSDEECLVDPLLDCSANLYRIGGAFTGADLDPIRDVITFRSPHMFLTGDRVILNGAPIAIFVPADAVGDPTNVSTENTIKLPFGTKLTTGDAVTYRVPQGGTAIGGLTNGTRYYLTQDPSDGNLVRLSLAPGGPAIVLDASVATGGSHWFDPVIGGLTMNTEYEVFRIDERTVKLRIPGGTYFTKTITSLNVDLLLNSGKVALANHGFTEGAAVTYRSPGIWGQFAARFVNVFDQFGNGVSLLSVPGFIYMPGHGFSTGDRVIYTIVKGAAIGGLTAGDTYYVERISNTNIRLAKAMATGTLQTSTSNGDATITWQGSLNWTDFGFEVGDTVDVTCNNVIGLYTVESMAGNVLHLVEPINSGFCVAVGVVQTQPILMTPVVNLVNPALDGVYRLTRPTDGPIRFIDGTGEHPLVEGGTYYVHLDPSDPTDSFWLRETPNGPDLMLVGYGLNPFRQHTLGIEGVDFQSGVGSFQLQLDFQNGGTGNLTAPGGVDLAQLLGAIDDGNSYAQSWGAGGSVGVTVGLPESSATVTPTAIACIGWITASSACNGSGGGLQRTVVDAHEDVTLASFVDARGSSYADTNFGSLVVNVGTAIAKTTVTTKSATTIGAGELVIAGGDADILGTARGDATARSNARGGAAVANNNAQAGAKITVEALITIATKAQVTVAGFLRVLADTSVEALTEATAFSGAIIGWSGAWANWTNSDWDGVELTVLPKVIVGVDAVIEADEISMTAINTHARLRAHAGAESFLITLIGGSVSYAYASVSGSVKPTISIGDRALITGWRGVDLIALVPQDGAGLPQIDRRASRLAVGIVPPQEGSSHGTTRFDSLIETGRRAHIRAGARGADTNLRTPPDDGRYDLGATTFPRLALYVYSWAAHGTPLSDTWTLVTETGYYDSGPSDDRTIATSNIEWDADVTVLGGADGAPTLVVDETGTIVKANGVLVNGGVPVVGQNVGSAYTVQVATQGPGNIAMAAGSFIRNVDTNSAIGWPLFTFNDTLGRVTIIDHSTAQVAILGIDVVAPADPGFEPTVFLVPTGEGADDPPYDLQFDLRRGAGEPFVDIQKLGTGRLLIGGAINNPTGWTHIKHQTGTIESLGGADDVITTNSIHLETPNGGIGTVGNRVVVHLVQSIDPGRDASSTADDQVRTTQIWAVAEDDVRLQIEAQDRTPAGNPKRPSTFVVYLDQISSSDGDVDLLLDDSLRVPGQSLLGSVRVRVWRGFSAVAITVWGQIYTGLHDSHFWPDDPGADGYRDPALYPLFASATTIDSTYRAERRIQQPALVPATFPGTNVEYGQYVTGTRQTVLGGPLVITFGVTTSGLTFYDDVTVGTGAALVYFVTVMNTGTETISGLALSGLPSGCIGLPFPTSVAAGATVGCLMAGTASSSEGTAVVTVTVSAGGLPDRSDTIFIRTQSEILAPVGSPDGASTAGLKIPGLMADGDIKVADRGGSSVTTIDLVAYTDLRDQAFSTIVGANERAVTDVNLGGSIVVIEPSGDVRLGEIRSRRDDVTIVAAGSILDGDPADWATAASSDPADVVGITVTLRAAAGTIGLLGDFLETDLIASPVGGLGVLNAHAWGFIGITETNGNLRLGSITSRSRDVSLPTDVAMTARNASIVDGLGPRGTVAGVAAPNIVANRIDLIAPGSIGIPLIPGGPTPAPVSINSSIAGPGSGRVFLSAGTHINVTETDDELMLLGALARGGSVQLATVDTTDDRGPPLLAALAALTWNLQLADDTNPEDLILLASGVALVGPGNTRTVGPKDAPVAPDLPGGIWGHDDITLHIGDDVWAPADTWIVAGRFIRIFGDQGPEGSNADPEGTSMYSAGVVGGTFDYDCVGGDVSCPSGTDLTEIFGNVDDDSFLFQGTFLGAKTHVFGSSTATNGGQADDGEDEFVVDALQTMDVAAGHTLTLDGQAEGDQYFVWTTGSQGARRNYVINALDTGATGTDTLAIHGTDESDDVFLLRRFASLVEDGWTATAPAFVALIHDNLTDAQMSDPDGNARPQDVQRINYDIGLNDFFGGIAVLGQGGDDTFASDDTSAPVGLDGGEGDDRFQVGQLYGTQRNDVAYSGGGDLSSADTFGTIPTTRGWLSVGNSEAMILDGGNGDDVFQVYANQALLGIYAGAGDDQLTERSFALAETTGNCTPADVDPSCTLVFRSPGVVMPLLVAGEPQYVVNAPVSFSGEGGFDKALGLATEFGDRIVVTSGGVFGAGLSLYLESEVVEVDGMEGDDTIDVVSTGAGVGTRVIGNLGSDMINVAGDVRAGVVADDIFGNPLAFPKAPHLLSGLAGPLEVIGGEGPERTLWLAVLLPGEGNTPQYLVAAQPSEQNQVDLLTMFDDSTTNPDPGELEATSLTGLGLAGDLIFTDPAFGEGATFAGGITIDPTLEVVSLLLGSGNDDLLVASTIVPGIDASTGVVADHGGLTVIHGGGGDDLITVTGGGGPDSPLVVYGDTSQDGGFYVSDGLTAAAGEFGPKPFANELGSPPTFVLPLANSFGAGGDDVIDASTAGEAGASIGITAYGGGGEDTLIGSVAGDRLAGGSGGDHLEGRAGEDLLLGDNGVNVDIVSRLLTTSTLDLSTSPSRDTLVAGSDELLGGTGNDVLVGDIASITQDVAESTVGPDGYHRPASKLAGIQTSTSLVIVESLFTLNGAADELDGGAGNDLLIAGTGADTAAGGTGNDLVYGDFAEVAGVVDLSAFPFSSIPNARPFGWSSKAMGVADGGGGDLLRGNAGDDLIIGGQGADSIVGGLDDDDLIGGHNLAGGSDEGDWIDGGGGNDWIAGDNADILRTGARLSARFRALIGTAIYDGSGTPLVTADLANDPNAANEERWITLFNHTIGEAPGTFGDDNIAGGARDDVVFGQLGNDWIQGDGSVIDDDGATTIDVVGTGHSLEDWAGAGTDGRDWVEGNGGDDTMFGGLGQDQLIGGSSSLYGLASPDLRPNGRDVIYGGSGERVGRNDFGNLGANGHAHDADVILGDNGNIFSLVGTGGVDGGGFLAFHYDGYGSEKIIPRAFETLDYTPGTGSPNDLGGEDLIHGEGGDDTIHGMGGNDVLFGDGQDDDIYGGVGSDRIHGGTGSDGILGDDGRMMTSRNGLTEPLNGVTTAAVEARDDLKGNTTGALVHITGELFKSAVLINQTEGAADVIYGGLGDDFLHGGAGDDAISGAEAERAFFDDDAQTDTNPLGYDAADRTLAAYDADNPKTKIPGFLLNFDAYQLNEGTGAPVTVNGVPVKSDDGRDRIFGDNGHDWLVGGTMCDWLFGGLGDDLLNLDDNLDTNGGLNNLPEPDVRFRDGDFAFGGAGLDVLIGNTGQDRMIDWHGDFNSFIVPFTQNGLPTVQRVFSTDARDLILGLGEAAGMDMDLATNKPFDELALVEPQDPLYHDQTGGPRDPQQAQTENGVQRDPVGGANLDCTCDGTAVIDVVKKLWSVDGSIAGVPGDAGLVPQGTPIYWTYELTNQSVGTATTPVIDLTLASIVDDNGTPGFLDDDFTPAYLSGDDGDGLLETGETWIYTSQGVVTRTVDACPYLNTVTVQASGSNGGTAVDTSDSRYTCGVTPQIAVTKVVNSGTPVAPTLAVGDTVTWTYTVTNPGQVPVSSVTVSDDNATVADVLDDFLAAYVSGDTGDDQILDPGETWIFTASGTVMAGAQCNIATATGTALGSPVSSTASACYTGQVVPPPASVIGITKLVNGDDADDLAAGPTVEAGSTVTWTYAVTITSGTTPVAAVAVSDDAGTPADPADDFAPAYVSGDDGNGLLDPGETWRFQAAGTAVSGAYCNLGTATGTDVLEATDPACYTGRSIDLIPDIDLAKRVNTGNPTVPKLPIGSTVTWTYTVTNPGDLPLSNVTIVDDNGTPADPTDDFEPAYVSGDTNLNTLLDPGEVWIYTASGVVGKANYCNQAVVEGTAGRVVVSAAATACYQPDTSTELRPLGPEAPSGINLSLPLMLLAFLVSLAVFVRREQDRRQG